MPLDPNQVETPTIDQSSTATPAATTEPAAEPSAAAPVATLDFDRAELEAAMAADAAEQATLAGPAASAAPSAPATSPSAAPVADPTTAPQRPATGVPLGRINEALRQRREAEAGMARAQAEAAYYRGQAEALAAARAMPGTPGAAPGTPTPKQLTPVEELAQIQAQRVALAERIDTFDISAKAAAIEQGKLNEREWQIRMEQMRGLAQSGRPASPEEDLYMDERTSQLEAQHPYALKIPDEHPIWETIRYEAIAQLAAEGVRFPPKGAKLPAHLELTFRERMARLTDKYGPVVVGDAPLVTGQSPGPRPNGAGAPNPAPTTPTAAQRAAKLALASTHPVDVNQLGQSSGGVDPLTDDQILNMTEEQIMAALPRQTLDRILNR